MTATTKRFVSILVLLILVGASLFVLAQQLRAQSNALVGALQTLANEAAVERAYTSLSEILDSSAVEREQIESYVVDGEAGTITFLTTVEDLAAQYGVELSGTTLETAEHETLGTPIIVVTFSFAGPRAGTEAYLMALETLPYASYLERASLITTTRDDAVPGLRGDVTIHALIKNIDL